VNVVDTLLGSRQLDLALVCLASLRAHSLDAVRLRIRDDGSLGDSDLERLAALDGEVVLRAEADDRVEPLLARHPACLAYRRSHPLGLKLFDVALVGDGIVAFCDSDVLFRRDVEGLFATGGGQAVFLRDVQNAYSLRSWQLLGRRLVLPERINSGLFLFPRSQFDLDLAEWYLRRREMAFAPMWQEQTTWALQAGRAASHWFDPAAFVIAQGPPEELPLEERDPAAIHFVTPARRHFDRWPTQGGPPLRVGAAPTRRLTALELGRNEVRRRLR
jgi:hypothetical protein